MTIDGESAVTNGKEFKGNIRNWWKYYPLKQFGSEGLGYVIIGTFDGHPHFDGEKGNTSFVVSHDEETGMIETLNSCYKLIGNPVEPPFRGDLIND